MKIRYTLLILMAVTLLGCNNSSESLSNEEVIQKYFEGYSNGNFEEMAKLIADTIKTIDVDFVLSKSRTELYNIFQWDSVFSPKYKVLEINPSDSATEATIWKTCKRIKFLHDTAIVCKYEFEFTDNKISKITTTDYVLFDFKKWQSRRDTLEKWINSNHEELKGYITDQSLKGAQNYVKAIDFYTNK